MTTSLSLGFADSVTFANVPTGTYIVALRAQNAAGTSAPSNAVTLTFPSPCSGPPGVPTDVRVYQDGPSVEVAWAPGATGPAPTSYVLIVTGSAAVNACGASAGTAPRMVVVP